jgi:hypothetical protein
MKNMMALSEGLIEVTTAPVIITALPCDADNNLFVFIVSDAQVVAGLSSLCTT